MSLNSKIFEERERNKAAAANVMKGLLRQCATCKRPSSKTRLFKIADGLTCLSCLPDGMSLSQVLQAEADHLAHLEAEANKPPPENFGEWS